MIIGITGSIATGKTTVTNYLQSLGYMIIDCDEIAHSALDDNQIHKKLVSIFNKDILNGDEIIDRKKLGSIVFFDNEKRKQLEDIVHPYVLSKIEEIISKSKTNEEDLVFISIPLLFEIKYSKIDYVVVVYTKQDIEIKRLMERDLISFETAEAKISSQIDIEWKKDHADYVIDNSGSIEETIKKIDEVLRKIKENTGVNI